MEWESDRCRTAPPIRHHKGEVSRSKLALHLVTQDSCKSLSIWSPSLGLQTERQEELGLKIHGLIMYMRLISCLEPQTGLDTSPTTSSSSPNMSVSQREQKLYSEHWMGKFACKATLPAEEDWMVGWREEEGRGGLTSIGGFGRIASTRDTFCRTGCCCLLIGNHYKWWKV